MLSRVASVDAPGGGAPLLSIEGIAHAFSGLQVLSGVSMEVTQGEVVGLVGPNGSGKTTLFNLITGIYSPQRGRIRLDGRDLGGLQGHEIAAAGIMRTFQAPRVFASLGQLEHAVISMRATAGQIGAADLLRAMRLPWRDEAGAASAVVAELELGDQGGMRAAMLPYGLKRRLEIARCLAGSPRLMLLDEPAAGLNTDEVQELLVLLARIRATRRLAMIVVDHDIDFVGRLCPRLVVLGHGQVVCDGPTGEVLRDPLAVATYFGEGPRDAVHP